MFSVAEVDKIFIGYKTPDEPAFFKTESKRSVLYLVDGLEMFVIDDETLISDRSLFNITLLENSVTQVRVIIFISAFEIIETVFAGLGYNVSSYSSPGNVTTVSPNLLKKLGSCASMKPSLYSTKF